MADYPWPFSDSDARYLCEAFDEALEFNVELSVSRSGKVSTLSLPGARWRATMQFPDTGLSELVTRRQIEAFLLSLRGGADRLLMWNPLTPQPLGTMRGPVTLAAAVLAGATTAQITGGTPAANTTLLRGDRIAFGGQRVVLTADATANGSGVMTVAFQAAHRWGASVGEDVTLTRPPTKFVLTQPVVQMPARGERLPGFAVELVEDFARSGDPYFSNVVLLLHGDGANGSTVAIDSSTYARTSSRFYSAALAVAEKKFGTASISIPNNDSYFSYPFALSFAAGEPITIELWIYNTRTTGTYNLFGTNYLASTLVGYATSSGATFSVNAWMGGVNTNFAANIPLNTWVHLAFVRDGSFAGVFVNGVLTGGQSSGAGGAFTPSSFNVGWAPLGFGYGSGMTGYIDDLRITKGIARYTANFTPPTKAFPDF